MTTDPLSDLLRTVRLTGAVFFEISAMEPWAIGSPSREQILPRILPGADHLIGYHVVTEGRCTATMRDEKPIELEAGEVIIFTSGQPHIMSSRPHMHAEPPTQDVLDIAAADQQPFCINLGEGTVPAKLVCGYLACDARPFNPLLENLPPVLTAKDSDAAGGGWISQFIKFAVAEAAQKHAGSDTVLTKLSELMFINVVRQYLENLPSHQSGWLAGLRDPLIAKALSLMHSKPAHDWTIDELAREAGLSRSVLAERFAATVGMPPMHYLARWRMQIASELLTGGGTSIASIAAEIGYSSEAAFSRAFRKMIGIAPSEWRKGMR